MTRTRADIRLENLDAGALRGVFAVLQVCAAPGLGRLRAAPCRRTASHLQAPQRVQWCVRQPAPSRACNPDVEVTRRPQQPLLGS